MTGKAGGMPTLKTMKTASRTLGSGRDADVLQERGHPARNAFGKRKTIEKANIFRNLMRLMGGAISKSHPDGWRTEGKRKCDGHNWGDGRPACPVGQKEVAVMWKAA